MEKYYYRLLKMTTRLLPAIVSEVLDNLKKDYEQRLSIEELLLSLNSIFGPVLTEHALELIDDESVFLIRSQERYIFQIVGSRGDIYTIMEASNFCTCDFFKYQVLKDRALCCKHFLAAKVGFILGSFKTKYETSTGITSILNCAYGNQEIKWIAIYIYIWEGQDFLIQFLNYWVEGIYYF